MSYFEEQLNCDETVIELRQLLSSISGWLENNEFHNEQTRQRYSDIEDLLLNKKRHVLFLAEFSRGKSELINSTIFGSLGRRYLPSTPGRTTRCTTVLQYDADELPSIRLLPTLGPPETQRQPVSMLQQNATYWERTPFAASDTESIINSLSQIAETEMVIPEIAKEHGFIKSVKQEELDKIDVIDGKVAIPKYRHAIINFPHPLLKQGLSIIDTPGLNALGIEPELTLRSLESANAIVFVVSADTGITRSELSAWNEYVKHVPTDNIIVVINKIDTLWDELNTQSEIDAQIENQVTEVARILKTPLDRVFPVSAQKSLVARKNNNNALTKASGINKYEQALADTINFSNKKDILDRVRVDVTSSLSAVQRVLLQRIESTNSQIQDISKSKQDQTKISEDNIIVVKKQREQLEKASEELNLFRVNMKIDYENFVKQLDIYALDKLIARYRFEISNQLTSTGLQREMNEFQLQAVVQFKSALAHISNLEIKLIRLYKIIENILETQGLKPRKIHPSVYLDSLKAYSNKHEKYARGFTMVVTEQNALRDRYHASVMVKIKKLYMQTQDEVSLWCKTVLAPLDLELQEKSSQLKKRLLSLERARTQDYSLNDELRILQLRISSYEQRNVTIDHFLNRLEELSHDDKPDINNVIDLRNRSSTAS